MPAFRGRQGGKAVAELQCAIEICFFCCRGQNKRGSQEIEVPPLRQTDFVTSELPDEKCKNKNKKNQLVKWGALKGL